MEDKECSEVGEGEFKLILPKQDNSKNPIKEEILGKYIDKINTVFGGNTTAMYGSGCYFDKTTKKLSCEENLRLRAYVTSIAHILKKYERLLMRSKNEATRKGL